MTLPTSLESIRQALADLEDLTRRSLFNGIVATNVILAADDVADGVPGDVVIVAQGGAVPPTAPTVVHGLTAALTNSSRVLGVLIDPIVRGSTGLCAVIGVLPPNMTGLTPGLTGPVRVDPTTGRCQRVTAFANGDYPVGFQDTDGNLTISGGQAVAASGSVGPLDHTVTVVGSNVGVNIADGSLVATAGGLRGALTDGSLKTIAGANGNPVHQLASFIDITDKPYQAVSSNSTTTGTITSGSQSLVVAAAQDFQIGQSLVVHGAGSDHGLGAPAAPTAVRFGASGTDTQDYKVIAVTREDGWSVVSAQSNQITDAPTTLTSANFIRIFITPVAGAYKYLVFGRKNSSGAGWGYRGSAIAHPFKDQRGYTAPTYFDDISGAFIPPRAPFPSNTATAGPMSNCLRTRITNIVGTTFTLADAARTSVTSKTVEHDCLLPLKDAIAALGASVSDSTGGKIFFPKGSLYRFTGDLFLDRCCHIEGAGGEGDNPATQFVFSDGFGIQVDNTRSGPPWCPGLVVKLGDRIELDTLDGHIFECTTAGVTGTVYPTWDTVVGHTTAETAPGTAVWTCRSSGSLRQGQWSVLKDFRLNYGAKTIPVGRICEPRDPDNTDSPTVQTITRTGGTTGPAITVTGSLTAPGTHMLGVQVIVTTGGPRGTAKVSIQIGNAAPTTNVTTAATVALGNGFILNFPNSADYVLNEGYNIRTSDLWNGSAITMRARARLYRISTFQAPGSAICIYGNENAFSNANNCYIEGGRHSSAVGAAVYATGGDTNHCTVIDVEGVNCPGGMTDNSFLGCRWISGYCSGGCTTQTFCNHVGNSADFYGCYAEGSQAVGKVRIPGKWFGGYQANGFSSNTDGMVFANRTTVYPFEVHNNLSAQDVWVELGAQSATPYILALHVDRGSGDVNPWRAVWDETNARYTFGLEGIVTWRTLEITTTDQYGSGLLSLQRGFKGGALAVERKIGFSAGVPLTNEIWRVGDIVWDISGTAGVLGYIPKQTTGTGPAWSATRTVKIGDTTLKNASTESTAGSVYVCTTPGTTGSTEPANWNNTTTTDGTVVWTNAGLSIAQIGATTAFAAIPRPTSTSLALTNADLNKGVTDAFWFVLPAATLTGNHSLTLNTTGAVKGMQVEFTREDVSANTYSIINGGGGAGTLDTFVASKRGSGIYVFDGTNWVRKHSMTAP